MTRSVRIDHSHDPALVSDHFPLVVELDLLSTSAGPAPPPSAAGGRLTPPLARLLQAYGALAMVAAVLARRIV
eukprot:CAMPEP_0118944492 /NCGR_PEP_ID=MMETSP1169-20130426/40410_1 /TAXON_ID=36882 /ORGANISM="Pyramimonas obovata, Strain CCMP722" /LENGTH=72 /DNA_ID=CAMNT_0006889989 /DNA_START=21 /DNA_END=239 /DNA_ORIENTATION=-